MNRAVFAKAALLTRRSGTALLHSRYRVVLHQLMGFPSTAPVNPSVVHRIIILVIMICAAHPILFR